MVQAPLTLSPVDTVQVRLIMDNAIDLLMAGSEVARRLPLGPHPFDRPQPIAEHGFSALITVGLGEKTATVLFDTGVSGFKVHQARRHGDWEPDPLIMDDQCAIVHVRDKGLVVVTGCGHAGIINTIRNAQALTGIDAVYAVVGGFHLSGPLFESRIPATIDALRAIAPRYVMPGHCTGWAATHQIARALPDAFIANSVGTILLL